MFDAESIPTLDKNGAIEVWHETEHSVTCYRISDHPTLGCIVHDLERGIECTWQEIWPYPGDDYVYGDLDTFRFAVQDHDLGWCVEDVLDLFGIQPDDEEQE